MTIQPETLMAYADGELDPLSAKRVERAIAADPALAEEVARHRALKATLRDAFAPVADAPVPAGIEALLRDGAKVVPIGERAARPAPRAKWIGSIAASLVAGLLLGHTMLPKADDSGIAIENGRAVARGDVARALGSQLASVQPADAPVRIGVTFRETGGDLCRTFEQGEAGGIACRSDGEWRLARLYGGVKPQAGTYRQAGSAAGDMMADAQAMMAGAPLDAAQERAALKGE